MFSTKEPGYRLVTDKLGRMLKVRDNTLTCIMCSENENATMLYLKVLYNCPFVSLHYIFSGNN